MSYISGARLVDDKQVKIAKTSLESLLSKRTKGDRLIGIEIKESPLRFRGPDVEARLSNLFPSRAVVLSGHRVRGGYYRIGVWAHSAEKHKYVRFAASAFSEIPPEHFHAGSKKGLGGWAHFLCDQDYTVLSCSGELCKKNLLTLSKNAQSKKKLSSSPAEKPPKVGRRLDKGRAREKIFALRKRKEGAIPKFFLRAAKALITFISKMVRISIFLVYNKILGFVVILSLSFYVWVYKGAIHLQPEHFGVMDKSAFFSWILDWENPGGLPTLQKPWGTWLKELLRDYGFFIKYFFYLFFKK